MNLVAAPLLGKPNSSHAEDLETYAAAPSEARQHKGGFTDPANDGVVAVQCDQQSSNGMNWHAECSPTLDHHSRVAVTHPLRADGFDASEDGTGHGTPIVAFNWQSGGDCRIDPAPLPSALSRGQTPAVAFAENQRGEVRTSEVALQLTSGGGKPGQGYPAVAAPLRAGRSIADTHGDAGNVVASPMSIRRLTPTECERLQGFPDGWTCLCGRNEGRSYGDDPCRCPDGPRYRALGNAVAVPVVEWLFRRILEDIR